MNWKRLAVYLWPLLAWPCMLPAGSVYAFMASGTYPVPFVEGMVLLAPYVLFDLAFPHFAVPVLLLFAISCHLWLLYPCWKTFLGTLCTSWVILGPIGLGLIAVAHFRSTISPHALPLSARILISMLIAASPYILLLFRALRDRKQQAG